jgi:hypothetical protein
VTEWYVEFSIIIETYCFFISTKHCSPCYRCIHFWKANILFNCEISFGLSLHRKYEGRLKSSCSGVIFIPLTVVRVWVTVVLKEPFFRWRSNYEDRLKSSWTGGSAPLLCWRRQLFVRLVIRKICISVKLRVAYSEAASPNIWILLDNFN